jgi:hypothetical protein
MLRLRAVVISLLPLVLTVAVAIPEARLQQEALGEAIKTEHASLAASNAVTSPMRALTLPSRFGGCSNMCHRPRMHTHEHLGR